MQMSHGAKQLKVKLRPCYVQLVWLLVLFVEDTGRLKSALILLDDVECLTEFSECNQIDVDQSVS
jgi:hypothetical protein